MLVATTIYDSCVVLRYSNLIASTQHFDSSLFQLQALFFAYYDTTSQCCDVFQQSLATIAEARSLHCTDLQLRTETVYHQSSQRFAFYIFCNDQQRTTCLYSRFKDRQEILQVSNLLVVDQYVWTFHYAFHLFSICDEVSRQITTVELHTFYYTDSSVSTLSFFDSDYTILRYLTHCISNELTDHRVIVSRDSCYLFNLVVVITYHFSLSLDRFYYLSNCLVDTALQVHRVSTSSNVFQTNANDRLSQYSSSCCTVTSIITSLSSYRLHQLSTCVLVWICQFYFLSYCYTILSDVRSTELLFDNHVTTFRAESYLHGVSQFVHALLQLVAGIDIEQYFFCHNFIPLIILQ